MMKKVGEKGDNKQGYVFVPYKTIETMGVISDNNNYPKMAQRSRYALKSINFAGYINRTKFRYEKFVQKQRELQNEKREILDAINLNQATTLFID